MNRYIFVLLRRLMELLASYYRFLIFSFLWYFLIHEAESQTKRNALMFRVQQSVTNTKCVMSLHNQSRFFFFQSVLCLLSLSCAHLSVKFPVDKQVPHPWLHHHLQTLFPAKFFLVSQTFENPMDLGPDYVGVWEKFKFQLPDCFKVAAAKYRLALW